MCLIYIYIYLYYIGYALYIHTYTHIYFTWVHQDTSMLPLKIIFLVKCRWLVDVKVKKKNTRKMQFPSLKQ